MKTILLIFTLVLAGAIISVHKKTAQNDKLENLTSERKPKILILLSNEKKAGLHTSLWWADQAQAGC